MSNNKIIYIAGVDEVGRGPLAGPVVAAAVILNPEKNIAGIKDSKKLTEKQRENLAEKIREHAIAFAIAQCDVHEIDKINIFQASLLAMQRAVMQLSIQPHKVIVDGKFSPQLPYPTQAIIKGDETEVEISAASILAKVFRDQYMKQLHDTYPQYGFAQHKGYGTAFHLAAIKQYGICPIHRRSFKPVFEYENESA